MSTSNESGKIERMEDSGHGGDERLARSRAPFHLYVPVASIDSARRLCADHAIPVSELWSYTAIGDQMRFTLVHRSTPPAPAASRIAVRWASASPVARTGWVAPTERHHNTGTLTLG